MKRKTRDGYRLWLAQELAVILNIKQRKAQHVITNVLQAVTKALQQGEDVYIKGFGTFYRQYEKPVNRYALYYHTVIPHAGRIIVRFEPDKELLLMVNKLYTGPEVTWRPPPVRKSSFYAELKRKYHNERDVCSRART